MTDQPYRIDVHHHIILPDYVTSLSEIGVSSVLGVNLPPWSVESTLEMMDRNGIQAAVTSISSPGVYFGDTSFACRLARRCNEKAALRMRIREISAVRVRYGYKRIHVLLRREGWPVNHKRVYRLYCEEGLNLRRKQKRKRAGGNLRLVRRQAQHINDCWSMDFAADALFNGRRFRVLSVVDIFSRECLGMEVNQGIKGQDVVELLDRIKAVRGIPGSIRCDNGPEFVSKALDRWAYENHVAMDFSRPGKPTDNAFAESFIGSLRDECLNVNWFLSLEDARDKIETWRTDYNEYRPHSSLGYRVPGDYAKSGLFKAGKLTA